MGSVMIISIAICTHNRSKAVARGLAALAAQTNAAPDVEILLIDSGSTDAEAAAIAHLAHRYGAHHWRETQPGLARARNAALAAARGVWLAFIDDDAIPAPDWLAVLRRTIAAHPTAGAIGGAILPQFEAPLPGWWPPSLRAALTILDQPIPPIPDPFGANLVVKRGLAQWLGGFPDCLGRQGACLLSHEETYMVRRLRSEGHTIIFIPDLIVAHTIGGERLNPAWLLQRQYWSGASEAVMLGALGEARGQKAWRMALKSVLLLPVALVPRASAWLIDRRCAGAFARGFVRGMVRGPDQPDALTHSP